MILPKKVVIDSNMRFEELKDVNDGAMIDSMPISLNYF